MEGWTLVQQEVCKELSQEKEKKNIKQEETKANSSNSYQTINKVT